MRLANYTIELTVPQTAAEEDLERMCRALSLLDLRSVVERLVRTYLRTNRALKDVRVRVEE